MKFQNDTIIDEQIVNLDSLEYIVPSKNLPRNIKIQNANNNLDAIIHNGYEFIAFRSAPYHWPNPKAKIYIVNRKIGEQKWNFMFEFSENKDLREPRFLSWNNHLYFYFAVLSGKFATFEPLYMRASELNKDNTWSEPKKIFKEKSIPWRTKVIDGVPYMIAYTWKSGSLMKGHDPTTVYFLTTKNGFDWEEVEKDHPVINNACSETDFVIDNAGKIYGISRNEYGKGRDWGSKLCVSSKNSPVDWHCVSNKKKFDSPLMFLHKNEVYLVARRNLTKSGFYNLHFNWLPPQLQTLIYEFCYWITPKRCSLWKIDKETLAVSFVSDLPSKGDTCFPAITKIDNDYFIYNYTSPIEGKDISWLRGQNGKTSIYRIKLNLP